ncbi:MAG: 2OG-Fe(II) oxygenase [Rickettsiales bacterium]|nr:2OG-Fe(II) oxygenase [Rickettsiales bacterium]
MLFCRSKSDVFLFDDDALQHVAEQHKDGYNSADPFPHAVIDNFMPSADATRLRKLFPKPDAPFWFDWSKGDTKNQPKKQGLGHIKRLEGAHPFIHSVLAAFNSYAMVHFLETLTGIDGLIPDPHYHGGGLHQILPGGKLKVHSDFNYLEKLKLYRKINVLLYLNEGWREEYGGHIELWDKDMSHAVQKVAPIFNRCVIFNTDSYSYHGHPEPLACPDGTTRKSIAFYYYTRDGRDDQLEAHSTLWQQRPDE